MRQCLINNSVCVCILFLFGKVLRKHIITKSMVSVFEQVVIELDYMFDKHFIRVHNNDRSDYNYDFRAFIIDCGDVLEFKNNVVYLRSTHPVKRTEKANGVIKFV